MVKRNGKLTEHKNATAWQPKLRRVRPRVPSAVPTKAAGEVLTAMLAVDATTDPEEMDPAATDPPDEKADSIETTGPNEMDPAATDPPDAKADSIETTDPSEMDPGATDRPDEKADLIETIDHAVTGHNATIDPDETGLEATDHAVTGHNATTDPDEMGHEATDPPNEMDPGATDRPDEKADLIATTDPDETGLNATTDPDETDHEKSVRATKAAINGTTTVDSPRQPATADPNTKGALVATIGVVEATDLNAGVDTTEMIGADAVALPEMTEDPHEIVEDREKIAGRGAGIRVNQALARGDRFYGDI